MRTAPGTRRGRAGFTLVELLVVITIIAILIGLLGAAVFKGLETAHRTQLRNEISELNKAVVAVQTEYNVKYIPSMIRLREDMAYVSLSAGGDQLDTDSFNFLHAMWPRLTIGTAVDWNGDGTPNGPWVLEGEQCLVFFTGGIPNTGSPAIPLGFGTNPANPTQGSTRKGPYFPFQSNRLLRSTAATSTNFLSYGDPMTGTPYAYFSSFSYWTKIPVVPNGPAVLPVPNRYGRSGNPPMPILGVSDCSSLGLSPFADVAPKPNPLNPPTSPIPHYLNNDTFQIISAGKDGFFGQGSMNGDSWTPANAPTPANNSAGGTGTDDMANFYDNLLGIAP